MKKAEADNPGTEARKPARAALIAAGLVCVSGVVAGLWMMLPVASRSTAELPDMGKTKAPSRDAWFEDVAGLTGIDFRHVSGRSKRLFFPEIMSGGVALFDYDNDGLLDAYFVQGGSLVVGAERPPPNRLFQNRGNLSFEDVTATSGAGDRMYGMGCACGDIDNDGFTDLYVTNVGPNVLLRNNGDGTFTDITSTAGVGDPSFSASSAFLDYDRDGFLDLFVVNYVAWSPETEIDCRTNDGVPDYCKPTHYNAPAMDTLYRNNGDGTFTNVTDVAGIDRAFGNGLGVICGDFNKDGWPDIISANDETANQLWVNQQNGTFRDDGPVEGIAFSGLGQTEAGMGTAARDVDGDMDIDILMTHFAGETNTLYLRETDYWEDVTQRYGLTPSRPFTGFGTTIADLNNDGHLDNYVANGRVVVGHGRYATDDPYAEPNLLLIGQTDGTFAPSSLIGGTGRLLVDSSRGAAFGDLDNDGGIDILVVNHDAAPYVLHNLKSGNGHWIMFDVRNRHGSPAIGARITLRIDGAAHVAEVRAAYSYCASNDPRVHFGLGRVTEVTDVHVRWPDGAESRFGRFPADAIVKLRKP